MALFLSSRPYGRKVTAVHGKRWNRFQATTSEPPGKTWRLFFLAPQCSSSASWTPYARTRAGLLIAPLNRLNCKQIFQCWHIATVNRNLQVAAICRHAGTSSGRALAVTFAPPREGYPSINAQNGYLATPTLKADAGDARHPSRSGGLNLLRAFGLLAFLAGLTQKILAHTPQDVASICRYSFSLARHGARGLWIRTNVG